MAKVETVLGPIDVGQMGRCLIHEHVMVTDWNLRMNVPGWLDEDKIVAETARRIRLQKEQFGVDTIGDPTPWSLGRDVALLAKIAEASETNILCCTGTYGDDQPFFRGVSEKTLVDYMVGEWRDGIQGTGIKPAMLKCATKEKGVDAQNERLLRATAKAHLETGLPIFTHTYPANGSGLTQQDVFEDEGVDLSRVVIGHCGDSNDIDYLEAILRRGSFIGLDRFGQDKHNPHTDRVRTTIELLRRGWGGRIVFSHDHLVFKNNDVWENQEHPNIEDERIDLRYMDRFVFPELIEAGITREQIESILTDNPRKIFS